MIQLKDDDTAELLNVSRQQLSRCDPAMAAATPWVGHCNKLRKRRRIRDKRDQPAAGGQQMTERTIDNITVTRQGRIVKKPARFTVVNSPEAIHKKEGEVVRSHEHERETRGCPSIEAVEVWRQITS